MSCTLDCNSQLTLMLCAGTGYTAWNNLGSLREISSQTRDILIIDAFNLINTESADFSSALTVHAASIVISFSFHGLNLLYTICRVKMAGHRRCRWLGNHPPSRWNKKEQQAAFFVRAEGRGIHNPDCRYRCCFCARRSGHYPQLFR